MPQILWLSVRKNYGAVVLTSAGPNQAAICNGVVYLSATVYGSLVGHTTEWEQISGVPIVTIVPSTATTASYAPDDPNAPGSDKVFRFWIDKGTQIEQYADVTIYTTPTTDGDRIEYGSGLLVAAVDPSALPSSGRYFVGSPYTLGPQFTGAVAFDANPVQFEWTKPEAFFTNADSNDTLFIQRYRGYVLQAYDGSTWNTVATYGLSSTLAATLYLGTRIRLGVLYDRGTTELSVNYTDWFAVGGSGVISANESLGAVEYGAAYTSTTVSRLVFTIVPLDVQDTPPILEYGATYVDTSVVRTVYVIEPLNPDTNATPIEYGSAHTKYSVTRTSGGSIGG